MSNKIGVTLIKARALEDNSDVHKMALHLTTLLEEKEGVEFKTRNSLTDATIKASNYIIFCGGDSSTLAEFFKCVAFVESNTELELPTMFFYDEPGSSIESDLNNLLVFISDRRRLTASVFKKLIYSWTYRDIIGNIDVALRKQIESPVTNL